jgi:hypothetical protein
VCGNPARTDLCGGRSAMTVPTATETTSYLTPAKIRDYFVWPASPGPHLRISEIADSC